MAGPSTSDLKEFTEPPHLSKINPPIVSVLCSCNAAVMSDRSCVRRLCSVRVEGARSAAGSALSGRFATSVTADHAVAGRNESSAEVLATLCNIGTRMVSVRQAGPCTAQTVGYPLHRLSGKPSVIERRRWRTIDRARGARVSAARTTSVKREIGGAL